MSIWQGRAQGCCASRWKGWVARLLISIGRWTRNLAEQVRLEALIRSADTRELFAVMRFLATALAERAFHTLRLLDGSPMPDWRCIHRQQTSFSGKPTPNAVFGCSIALRSQKLSPGARWLTKLPLVEAPASEQLWHDFVVLLTRNRVNWLSRSPSGACL